MGSMRRNIPSRKQVNIQKYDNNKIIMTENHKGEYLNKLLGRKIKHRKKVKHK